MTTRPDARSYILAESKKRILTLDGAWGSMIQTFKLQDAAEAPAVREVFGEVACGLRRRGQHGVEDHTMTLIVLMSCSTPVLRMSVRVAAIGIEKLR